MWCDLGGAYDVTSCVYSVWKCGKEAICFSCISSYCMVFYCNVSRYLLNLLHFTGYIALWCTCALSIREPWIVDLERHSRYCGVMQRGAQQISSWLPKALFDLMVIIWCERPFHLLVAVDAIFLHWIYFTQYGWCLITLWTGINYFCIWKFFFIFYLYNNFYFFHIYIY